ncbi:8-oxo-dGTP pyrophosphatase MutT (NUDIX family) [Nocardia transvalensis]|uniref:8-oxo-dGTP pyrophosphatase MutT (NUDIX family) n=1 Tax=Nocardia transvalensis TaxID=37333 RepID=A0A7W9PG79_9NOCA|nr:NUDIX domain-containing protein [Nocardia transvalensis]MBB5915103.1 8-oxo-dGTP pyrophosphatase MutT (NUDIX family) [Nocardia transvalensis]
MADRHLIDVHVLLTDKDDRLLLTRRRGSDEFDGRWHLPSGKLDALEPISVAAAREAYEEVGVSIDPADLRVVHVTHVAGSGPEPRLGVFLHASSWRGEPSNREPEKCSAVRWFSLGELPEDVIEYPAVGIRAFLEGEATSFSEHGWEPVQAAV